MSDVNVFTFTGRIVRDAELHIKENGVALCDFSVANNYDKKIGEKWTKEVNFFDLVLFGKKAQSLHSFLKQGVLVAVDAEIRQSHWEQEGKKRVSNEIIVNNIHFLSSLKREQQEVEEIDEEENPFEGDLF